MPKFPSISLSSFCKNVIFNNAFDEKDILKSNKFINFFKDQVLDPMYCNKPIKNSIIDQYKSIVPSFEPVMDKYKIVNVGESLNYMKLLKPAMYSMMVNPIQYNQLTNNNNDGYKSGIYEWALDDNLSNLYDKLSNPKYKRYGTYWGTLGTQDHLDNFKYAKFLNYDNIHEDIKNNITNQLLFRDRVKKVYTKKEDYENINMNLYYKFLAISANREYIGHIIPNLDIDIYWHSHMINPKEYYEYTNYEFNSLLDHNCIFDTFENCKSNTLEVWEKEKFNKDIGFCTKCTYLSYDLPLSKEFKLLENHILKNGCSKCSNDRGSAALGGFMLGRVIM